MEGFLGGLGGIILCLNFSLHIFTPINFDSNP
jgi:hypothetical protein